jgi:hypothetical protein
MKEILTMSVLVRTRNVLGGWLRDESLTRMIIPQILTPLYYITAQTRSTYSHDRQLVIFSFDSGVRSEYHGSFASDASDPSVPSERGLLGMDSIGSGWILEEMLPAAVPRLTRNRL